MGVAEVIMTIIAVLCLLVILILCALLAMAPIHVQHELKKTDLMNKSKDIEKEMDQLMNQYNEIVDDLYTSSKMEPSSWDKVKLLEEVVSHWFELSTLLCEINKELSGEEQDDD